jgi:lanosterol synthase
MSLAAKANGVGFAPGSPTGAVREGLRVLAATQAPQGSWKGDYGGPLFLVPVYVAGVHAMDKELDAHTKEGFVRYLRNHQNDDGGWGLDVESHSHVFTSVLNYVALRMMGAPAEDPALVRARDWFLSRGGPVGSGSWGKFILAMLGLYDYAGLHPVQPELWLLPTWLPVHPSRLWCHCRMVYLPMSWLYGTRFVAPETPLLVSIREEIYGGGYGQVDWKAARDQVASTDTYTPRSTLLKCVSGGLHAVEALLNKGSANPAQAEPVEAPRLRSGRTERGLRERALSFVLEQIRGEDEATHHIDIGPINKVLNAVVIHQVAKDSEEARAHFARLKDYLHENAEGIRVNGYNSSELWDTAFAVQAICATGDHELSRPVLEEAARFIEANQVLDDSPKPAKYFRHPSKGGWPFSTRDHGWPISDCTGEGLKASLLLEPWGMNRVPKERLAQAVEVILSLQNEDGGWATYERQRGPRWLELLNPSDVFSTIMVDISYVECTSSCVTGLAAWRRAGNQNARVDRAIGHGVRFLRDTQREDGSWEGSWGVCFSYGTWFAVQGLVSAGVEPEDPALRRAVAFLKAKQRPDGSWSETAESCRRREWVEGKNGHAVNTSWALLALAAAGAKNTDAVRRGVAWLKARQGSNGRWPKEPIAGVFNRTCAIHYDAYLRVFPVWALALCE